MLTPEHTTSTHTLLQRQPAIEAAQTLSSQKVSEHVPEGLSSHLGALLHAHFPLGLPSSRLADLRPLGAGVGVTAASERPSQTLLSRDHVEPVP